MSEVLSDSEFGIRPAPFGSAELGMGTSYLKVGNLEYARQVQTETLPIEIVKEVKLNPRLTEFLHPNLHNVVDENFLLARRSFTVPPDSSGGILTPYYMGRALPTDYGVIPYADIVGGIITAKGAFLAGRHYGSIAGLEDPNGLISDYKEDEIIALENLALDYGMRATFTLGSLKFDQDALEAWLIEKWKNYETGFVAKEIARSFNVFRKRQVGTSMRIRVSGSGERIMPAPVVYNEQFKPRYQRRRETELARSCGNFLIEYSENPQRIDNYCSNWVDTKEVLQTLGILADRQNKEPLTKTQTEALTRFLVSLSSNTIASVWRMHEDVFGDKYSPMLFGKSNYHRDVDLSWISHDFDDMRSFSNQDEWHNVRKSVRDGVTGGITSVQDWLKIIEPRFDLNAREAKDLLYVDCVNEDGELYLLFKEKLTQLGIPVDEV